MLDAALDVGVHVDKAGRDDQAPRVDQLRAALRGDASDLRDAPVLDGQVSLKPRVARAVHDAAAGNDQVEFGRGRGGAPPVRQREQEE
jgi:hypothetical protein